MTDHQTTYAMFRRTCVATITTVLRDHGLHNMWIRGSVPLRPGQPRTAGPAFTIRFVPMREDYSTPDAIVGPRSSRAAIERMPSGCIVVADAMGFPDCGVFGDIMCARMQYRGVAGLVTDGAVRDRTGILNLHWPVWAAGISAPPSNAGLYCADEQVPVACGGVAIMPGDVVVADDDGAVVVPFALAADVARTACEKELFEDWALAEIQSGAAILGTYPPNDETMTRFKAAAVAPDLI